MVLVGERIIHPLCMIDRPWLWVTPMLANDTDAGVIINGAHEIGYVRMTHMVRPLMMQ